MRSAREEMARERLKLALSKMSDIPGVDLGDLVNIFTLRHFPKKSLVISQTESTEKLFFILRGMVRIYYVKEDREITNWFIDEDNFFAATYSLFTGEPNVYLYEALEDLEVLCCDYADMQRLYTRHHAYEHIGRKMIEYYYTVFLKRSYDIMSLSAEERYHNILQNHPDWFNRVPLKYIASYLGITQETLSRLRAK